MDIIPIIMKGILIILGLGLLGLGRQLFWLFIAAAGFVLGLSVGNQLAAGSNDWVTLIIALLGGVLGFVLAIRIQKLGLRIAGFVVGGYVLVQLISLVQLSSLVGYMNENNLIWVGIFIVGGIFGAILTISVVNIALIGLSATGGSLIVVQALDLEPTIKFVIFLVLLLLGIFIQGRGLDKDVIPET